MNIFETTDKTGRKIRLNKKQWKHILKHPDMHNRIEDIKEVIKSPPVTRYSEDNENVKLFYKEFKYKDPSERYMLVSVKYLNNRGFVITSFFTNKITGLKW